MLNDKCECECTSLEIVFTESGWIKLEKPLIVYCKEHAKFSLGTSINPATKNPGTPGGLL